MRDRFMQPEGDFDPLIYIRHNGSVQGTLNHWRQKKEEGFFCRRRRFVELRIDVSGIAIEVGRDCFALLHRTAVIH